MSPRQNIGNVNLGDAREVISWNCTTKVADGTETRRKVEQSCPVEKRDAFKVSDPRDLRSA